MIDVEPEEHPLFARDDDDPRPPAKVDVIHVTRAERSGVVWCPRSFEPDELQSLAQLFELYGGGTYELIGRDSDTGRVSARRKYVIDGPSKPFVEEQKTQPAPAPQVAPPQPAVGAGDSLLVAVLGMMTKSMEVTAQMMTASQQATTQLLATVLAESKNGSNAQIQAIAEMARADKDRTTSLVERLLALKQGGAGGTEDFLRGVEFATALGGGEGSGGFDLEKVLELLGPVAEAWLKSRAGEAQAEGTVNPGAPSLPQTASSEA